MSEFEATLDREIDAQRRQLMQTLATNRAQKIEAQLRELRSKSQMLMQQNHAQQAQADAQAQQQPQQQHPSYSFSTIAGSPSAGVSSQSSSSVFSAMPPTAERQRQEQQAEAYARQAEQAEEQHRASFMQQQAQQQQQQQPTASPAHRYAYNPSSAAASKHSVTRVEHTPSQSPALSPSREPQQQLQAQNKYVPVPASSPASAAAAPAKFTTASPPRAVVSAIKDEDPLRAQWMHLQAELHGGGAPAQSHTYKPATALSAVSAASPSVGPQAATAANMTKLESALEMDWDSVWSEIETQKPSSQQQNGQGPSAQYAYRPPTTQQRNGASRSNTSQSRSPSRDRSRAMARAPQRTPLPSNTSTAAPVQVLQQASSLFKSTLHELEERAEYLHTLIAAFKDAGKEMDSTILQQSMNLSMAQSQAEREEQRYHELQRQHEEEEEYEQQYEQQQQQAPPPRSRSSHATQQPRRSLLPQQQQPQQRSASRPRVAFAPAAAPAARPRSASQAPTSRNGGNSALNRSASSSSVVSAAAAGLPARKAVPSVTAARRPASASLARPAAAAPVRPAASTAAAAAAPRRPSAAPVSTASSYPRPRTASARAARTVVDPGVAAAQARIRAILAKTRPARTRGVSAQTHPHVARPRDVLLEEPRAKGGVRKASVQEVLQGAEDIAARKSQPVALRSKPGQQLPSSAQQKRTALHKKDPADEYDFEPSTDEHPHHPLSLVAAAKMQAASTARLQTHAGVPSHASFSSAGSAAVHPAASPARASYTASSYEPHPDDEFGALMHEAEPSLLDDSLDGSGAGGGAGLNTTAGLIQQEAVAQARHGGQLEEYLKALSLPSHSEERRLALERLAAKSKQAPQAIYASPLRTHSAQAYQARAAAQALATAQGHGAERYNARANVIVRGSHSNDAPQPEKVQRVGGLEALQRVMNAHDVRVPVPQ